MKILNTLIIIIITYQYFTINGGKISILYAITAPSSISNSIILYTESSKYETIALESCNSKVVLSSHGTIRHFVHYYMVVTAIINIIAGTSAFLLS